MVRIEFDRETQNLAPIQEAAYKFLNFGSCHITRKQQKLVCTLAPRPGTKATKEQLRSKFLDLVTDENLRETIAGQTNRIRDVIVALAFGSIAKFDAEIK